MPGAYHAGQPGCGPVRGAGPPRPTGPGRREEAAVTSSVAAVWGHRGVLRLLVQRDLAVKYQQSVLGYVWSLIEPLAMATIYWFIFGVLYDTELPGGPPYPMFVLSAIFAWMWANSAIGEATAALTGQARLITVMNVPREVFPIGRVVARFAEYLAGLPILFGGAVIFGAPFGWYLVLCLPLAIVLQALLLIGLAMLLSAANVLLRDVERFMRLVQRVLFYAAPIIYPLSRVTKTDAIPDWVKLLYQANPLVGIMQLHHAAWYPSQFPGPWLLATTTAGCLITLVTGWWVFRRLEPAVLKEL
jgi:ABC-2 type transport system permease protein